MFWKLFYNPPLPQTEKTPKKCFFPKPYFSRPNIFFCKKCFWSWFWGKKAIFLVSLEEGEIKKNSFLMLFYLLVAPMASNLTW